MSATAELSSLPAPATPLEQIQGRVAQLRRRFDVGVTRPKAWRAEQLDGLARLVEEQRERITAALAADLGKPQLEALLAEVDFTAGEARRARRALGRWMAPERVSGTLITWPSRSQILREPLGVALIIAPWNYPFGLVTAPLIAALEGGVD